MVEASESSGSADTRNKKVIYANARITIQSFWSLRTGFF